MLRCAIWLIPVAVGVAVGWFAVAQAGLWVGWGILIGLVMWALLSLLVFAAQVRRVTRVRMPTLDQAQQRADQKPDDAKARNELGAALEAAGRMDEAITAFRKAIELEPRLSGAYTNLALLLRDQGKGKEAIAVLEQGIEQCSGAMLDIMREQLEQLRGERPGQE